MVAHRVIWSFVVCGAWILLLRRGSDLLDAARDPRMIGLLVCSALLIGANWSLFLWGTASDHVVDVSLGYFINPLVSVALGVVVLHERPSRLQLVALAFSLVAVVVLTAQAHHLPYLSLGLAGTFAGYGFVKKSVTATPLAGMTLESAVLAPVAVGVLWHLHAQHELALFQAAPAQQALLVGLGAATAIPLMLFAAAASSLTLTEMGLLQYLTPIGQFLIGTLVLSEAVDPTRWVAVAMIWVAVILIVADGSVRRFGAAGSDLTVTRA
jgi:chloramphenicol-sensitive protein RarD